MQEKSRIKGKLHSLPKPVLKKDGTPIGTKHEFRIIKDENSQYPKIIAFQLIGKGIEFFPKIEVGTPVEIEYDLSGREWEERCFIEALAWRVSVDELQQTVEKDKDEDEDEELPF